MMSTQQTTTAIDGQVRFTPYTLKKGESYMSEGQCKHFRDILHAWKAFLQVERDHTVEHIQKEAMNRPDPVDRASLEEEYALELRARDRDRRFLKKIQEALELMDAGDYGFCEECGAEIGLRRLEARPTATQCIDCKTFGELKEKQIGS